MPPLTVLAVTPPWKVSRPEPPDTEAARMPAVMVSSPLPANTVSLPVSDNVTMPTLATAFRRWMLDRRGMVEQAAEMGRRFEVRPADSRLPMASLSGGNAQKVVLAKWFQMTPKLILLDEPTQGVDIGARQTVFRHIAAAAEAGAAVLCASSDYEQLAAICSRVLIFAGGRVVASLEGDAISKDAIAERSLAGEAA